jgi:tetratricopeptide (TPR) repeat protein
MSWPTQEGAAILVGQGDRSLSIGHSVAVTAKRKRAPSGATPVKTGEKTGPEGTGLYARWTWGAILILVVAVVAVYANSLHGPFVFDDEPSIVANPSIRNLASPRVLLAPPEAVTVTGRPLVNLSLALNYAMGGLAVEGYHLVNLILHILAALALFGLVRRTLILPNMAARFGSAATGLALGVALLWALHPLQTESVTYIVQRAEVMVGLFYFLTLYCFLRGTSSVRGKAWYAAAVGACVLGTASKEVMATAPLLAILFDRTFITGSFRESLQRRWRLWLALIAPWALLALLYAVSGSRGGSAGFGLGMGAWQYARTQFGCIVHYLRLAVWPDPLVLDYGQRIANSVAEIVPYAVAVLLLVAATVVGLVRRPKWGFLGAWFFVILAPSSSIVPLATQTQAEHRMYLPLAALAAVVVFASHLAMLRLGRQSRGVALALVVMAASALGWRTRLRNQDYQSELALWEANIRDAPSNDRAYLSRGGVYWDMGRYDDAFEDYQRSLALNPRNHKAYVGRGNVYVERGQHEQALRDYQKAIALNPKLVDAYDGRGSVLLRQGQIDLAIKDFDTAIKLDPDLASAYFNRANAHDARREVDAAIRDYDLVIRLRPDFAGAYSNRGNALQSRGRYAEAIRDYDKAIALRPDLKAAFQNRAIAHLRTGAYDQAWSDVHTIRQLGGTPIPAFVEDLIKKSGRTE